MCQDRNIKNSLRNYDESEDSDFSRTIMPEHSALAYTKKEEKEMAKKNAVKSNDDVKETKVSTKAKAAEKQQEEPVEEKKPGFLDRAKKIGKTVALIGGVVAAVAVGSKLGQAKGYREGIRDREEFGNDNPALPEPPEDDDIIEDEEESSDDV